jgi:hypothetical protein
VAIHHNQNRPIDHNRLYKQYYYKLLKFENMASTSESGHAKNLANFEKLISYCAGYGADYNPSNENTKLEALNTLLTNSRLAADKVNLALPLYSNATAARDAAFKPLSKFVTRILNALKATTTTKQVDENARTLVRKIQGRRANPKLSPEEKKTLTDQGQETKEISSSQLSFDNRLENLDKLIKLLEAIPQYNPNEKELKITALKTFLAGLQKTNKDVIAATTSLSNARIERNNIMYSDITGLTDIAQDVKAYVKSLYEASSPLFKQVSGLEFKRVLV